ncbi:MAG TPA: S41 family peptidase [Bryobacteraceae bacterium]|nr:S41 family peptidase [Bryobacteraceae bacterium]
MNSRFKLVVVTSSTCLVVLLLLGAVMGQSASTDDAYQHLKVYTEVLSRIKSEYVEEPDIKNVTLGATNGMLEAIDPFASYLSSEQYKSYLKNPDPKKANVGLTLSRRFGYVGVVNAIPGSSGQRAGLSTGDILESINGVATRDMPLAYAEMLLAGEPGSTIELSVLRVRKPEPTKITLNRTAVRMPAVTSELLPDQIGLIRAPFVDTAKVKDISSQLEALTKQGAKKVILDLRFSGFGKPEAGVELANLFMDKGLLTYSEGQKIAREEYKADPAKAQFKTQPLIVLVNRGTANAAEVAAAALLDSKRAELVGEPTYGDAAIRKPVSMDDGSAVILSVAKYYTPNGKAIQDTRITPTYLVAESDGAAEVEDETAEAPAAPAAEPKKEEDAILKRAVELLTKGSTSARKATEVDAAKESTPARESLPPAELKEKKK